MEKVLLRRKHLVPLAAVSALVGCALVSEPASAQQRSRTFKRPMATITVTAAPIGNLREVQKLIIEGNKFLAVSASVPVPYGDLNLGQTAGADELNRRVKLAARMACDQLDAAYPPHIYAVMGTDDCVKTAIENGLHEAESVIAQAKG